MSRRERDGVLTRAAVVSAWVALGISLLIPSFVGAAGQSAASSSAQPAAGAGHRYPGIGRTATPAEVRAWDIDVRADFKGLPAGRGSVARGQDVWEAKCASCHGVFGESNEVFTPIVGGTNKRDIETGRVAALTKGDQRTTLMKLSTVSTLWDYINRAMPWNAPKTLSVEEVYAVTAYILHLGDIVPADFTLSNENIAQVQQRLPNRNGMTNAHGLWRPEGKPDVIAKACMKDCGGPADPNSSIPDYARNAHGNLAEQQRIVGAQRGSDTTQPAPRSADEARSRARSVVLAAAGPVGAAADPTAVAEKNGCGACHGMSSKILGPAWRDIAGKHSGRSDIESYLANKIRAGGQGVWGEIPMPAQAQVSDSDAAVLARWIAGGAR